MSWDRVEPAPPYEPGIARIKEARCPRGATRLLDCLFCPEGHISECHYPQRCQEAQCSHLERYD